jgi:hypothetical protein
MAGRLALFAFPVVCALVLAGSAVARSPHETTYRPVTADVRTAKSLLVTRADVPGFRDSGAPDDRDATCSAYDPDLSALVTTGEAEGRYYTRTAASGALTVGSQAALFTTAAQAKAYWMRAVTNKKITPCLAELFRRGLPVGSKLTNVKTIPITAATGALEVHSWNLVGRVHVDGNVVPFVLEAVGLKRGRAISFLFAMSVGKPLVEQVERIGAVASAKLAHARLGSAVPAS